MCPDCGKRFSWWSALKIHQRDAHGREAVPVRQVRQELQPEAQPGATRGTTRRAAFLLPRVRPGASARGQHLLKHQKTHSRPATHPCPECALAASATRWACASSPARTRWTARAPALGLQALRRDTAAPGPGARGQGPQRGRPRAWLGLGPGLVAPARPPAASESHASSSATRRQELHVVVVVEHPPAHPHGERPYLAPECGRRPARSLNLTRHPATTRASGRTPARTAAAARARSSTC